MVVKRNNKTNVKKSKDKIEILQCTWRPLAAHVYLGICIFDFVVMPILQAVLNHHFGTDNIHSPLTLKESGLFHLAYGAILGVSAWTRGKEKIEHAHQEHYAHQEHHINTNYSQNGK